MATIDDVARAAGVSASTVSYALSGKRPISQSTRRRIEAAIASLDYRPSASARALATSRSSTIGLMAPLRPGVDLNVIMQFVSGITAAAHEHDHDVLLVTHDDEANLARVSDPTRIDALLVMDVEADDPRLARLRRLSTPVVLIGLPRDTTGLSCIDLDFAQAGAIAARTLADLGHRSIALLGAPTDVLERRTSYAEHINAGFAGEAAARGIAHEEWPVHNSVAGAREAVRRLLEPDSTITGIVVHNENALPHIVAGLEAAGRSIPRDLSLIAVCPENVALAQPGPITSIDIPAERIGRMAVEMLMSRMADDVNASEVRLIGPSVHDRGSAIERTSAG